MPPGGRYGGSGAEPDPIGGIGGGVRTVGTGCDVGADDGEDAVTSERDPVAS